MRRSRNVGHVGGGVNLNMSGGPLLTEHLKDIDLELELLKRKREMLEQQQQQYIQPFNPPPQRSFNQQPYSFSQSSSNYDFSHLYNDGSHQNRKSFGRKRQAEREWVSPNNNPKRSPAQVQRISSNTGPAPVRNQRPFSGPSQQPKVTPFKYGQGRIQRPDKKILGDRVTKPTRSTAPPNKIASQPVPVRKDLVAAAVKSATDVVNREREAFRLLPDKTPSKQLNGRLELALGAILKDIRERCAGTEQADAIRPANVQRLIKQVIRSRIRSAMLGKIVGAVQDIVKEYRDQYPIETDNEILAIGLEAAGVNQTKTAEPDVKIEKPEKIASVYFKQNLFNLLDSHLREMFDKLNEIYNPDATKEIDFTSDNVETVPALNNQIATPETVEQSSEMTENNPGATEKADESGVPDNTEDWIVNLTPNDYKRLLPRFLRKHIPTIIKLINVNKIYQAAFGELEEKTRSMLVDYVKTKTEESEPEPVAEKSSIPPQSLYFVKVMGKPQLPKKKVMQSFLEVFNPKSIKKHRQFHNLLFVGVGTKEEFDGIIKADGTVIDRSTLSIRVCDKSNGKPEDTANGDDGTAEDEKDTLAKGDLISPELDGQITDLLSSIRQSEENNDGEARTADENVEGKESSAGNEGTKSTEDNGTQDNTGEEITKAVAENQPANVEKKETPVDQVAKGDQANETPQEENKPVPETQEIKTEASKPDTETKVVDNSESVNLEADNKTDAETKSADPNEAVNKEANNTDVDKAITSETKDQVGELKSATSGRSTPTRASSRLTSAPATPSSIRTRRASRLLQN